jgi:DNA-binding NtrC family response regulator
MSTPPNASMEKLLVADDNPVNINVLRDALEPHGYEILAAPNGATALKIAQLAHPGLILLDIMMPGMDGLAACRALKSIEATRDIPVIFLTARQETESLAQAFEAGGVDYVTKPFQPEEILIRIETHLRSRRLNRELTEKNAALEQRTAELIAANEKLREEVSRRERAEDAVQAADEKLAVLAGREADRWGVAGFIGKSKTVSRIIQDVRKLHNFGATSVMLTGESGTGKELIARAIHCGGQRAAEPFIPVNCVAIPAELAESMFFGHLKGSFTGALTDRKGFFELAHRGTLFLDEIGDMPLPLQAKLLRVLEDGIITPVGAGVGKAVDVRVIAATNVDLHAKIASGAFRQDLYFRLARFTVVTPPLRERPEDIPILARHFLDHFAVEMGMRNIVIQQAALDILTGYSFPGNVRELKNIIERALIESGGKPVEPRHLHLLHAPASPHAPASTTPPRYTDLPLSVEAAEEALIQRALSQTNGNIAEAARLLGINRTRIYRKLASSRAG